MTQCLETLPRHGCHSINSCNIEPSIAGLLRGLTLNRIYAMCLFSLQSYDAPIGVSNKHELMTHLFVGPRSTEMSKKCNDGGANRDLPVGVFLFTSSHYTSDKDYAFLLEQQ